MCTQLCLWWTPIKCEQWWLKCSRNTKNKKPWIHTRLEKLYPSHVYVVHFPPMFVQPHFNTFNGTSCPKQHIAYFESQCGSIVQHGDLLLKLFVLSLDGVPFTWYLNLKLYFILDWDAMKWVFVHQFHSTYRTVKLYELLSEKQWDNEFVVDFINR